MGPGPSNVPQSVLNAMSSQTIGHLDPEFLILMDQIRSKLRQVFGTDNEVTIPISGTGSAGMETCLVNLLEPGDCVLVGINGVFGNRLRDVAERACATVTEVEQVWGRTFDVDQFREAANGKKFKLVCVVHAETSTGALQELQGFDDFADEVGALLLVDTVTSLGGVELNIDESGIDATYSGTQKCLSCPPGLSPVSFSDKALEVLSGRKTPVQSWYFDLTLITQYWGEERAYHHTAPINMLYGLHEALELILDEGLQNRAMRHLTNCQALIAGLQEIGLEMLVPESERLPSLTSVCIPPGMNDEQVRRQLLENHGLEIGGGLGPLKGKIWRIGLMGASSTSENVSFCLSALSEALRFQGF